MGVGEEEEPLLGTQDHPPRGLRRFQTLEALGTLGSVGDPGKRWRP